MSKRRKPTNRARQKGRAKPAPARRAVTRSREWRPEFLAALTRTCDVTRSCALVGVSRDTAYEHRDKDEAFREAWAEAIKLGVPRLADRAEEELVHRALEGVPEPVLYQGQPCFTAFTRDGSWCHEKDPAAVKGPDGKPLFIPMMVAKKEAGTLFGLLKALKPEKYRERVQVQHENAPGPRTPAERASAAAAIVTELQGLLGPDPGGGGPG